MFVFAPDIAVKTHPVRFSSGSWTSVTGVMTGTMDHEWLFWDNQDFMKQLRLGGR